MTPEDMKALWASHCRYEFELRDVDTAGDDQIAEVGPLDPRHVPAFGADTATRLRDLPPS
jgi:hypothetical protein